MILIRVSQGLGNQMFQFALGIVLSEKYKEIDVKYDITHIANKIANRKMISINNIFEGDFKIASFKEIRKVTGIPLFKIPILYNWFSKYEYLLMYYHALIKKFAKKNITVLIQEPKEYWNISDDFVTEVISKIYETSKNYSLLGFWENSRYFKDYEEIIKKYFKFKNKFSVNNELYNSIISSNSVSLHVRRGDYLKISKGDFNFNICDLQYYFRAIEIINNQVENPIFFIFSDDAEFVKEEFEFLDSKIIVSDNKDYIDMQLMSLCKHNIIANSTFSFWAAFLNNYSNKKVIYPVYHYRRKDNEIWENVKLPSMKGWIGIDNIKEDIV